MAKRAKRGVAPSTYTGHRGADDEELRWGAAAATAVFLGDAGLPEDGSKSGGCQVSKYEAPNATVIAVQRRGGACAAQ